MILNFILYELSRRSIVKFNSILRSTENNSPERQQFTDITFDSFTPRMNDACRRELIDREDLIRKTRDEIISIIKNKDPTG